MKYPASLSKTCIAALFLLSAGPALAAPVPCEGEESEIVGLVVAANGVAKAFREGESEPRSLACNDAIHACEIVVTEPGAEVGIKTGEVYAHVAGGSQLQVSSADGGAILALRSGSFRLIDPREAGSPAVQVRTPHLTTAAQGTDTEFFVNAGETSSRLCNHLASLDVSSTGGGSSLVLDAGCAVSSGLDGGTEALCVARDLLAAGDADRIVVVAVDDGGDLGRELLERADFGERELAPGAVAVLLRADPLATDRPISPSLAADHGRREVGHLAVLRWLETP